MSFEADILLKIASFSIRTRIASSKGIWGPDNHPAECVTELQHSPKLRREQRQTHVFQKILRDVCVLEAADVGHVKISCALHLKQSVTRESTGEG